MNGALVMGTGGHAKVAADILLEMGIAVVGFLDDNPEQHGLQILGFPVLGSLSSWDDHPGVGLVLGIGANAVRQELVLRWPDAPWMAVVHPRATVSRFASIHPGAMVCFGVCIGPDAIIGTGVIVNTCASVDHDCLIGDFAHVAVGATIAGGVTVGEGSLIGAGSVVRPNVRIGQWCTVGAGAAVVSDLPDRVTALGVPARWKA